MSEGEKYSEAGFLQRTEGNKISYNPLSIDEYPQPSPEQERLFEIDIDKGVSQRLREARAIGPSVRQQTQAEILNLVLLYRELGGNPFSVRRLPFSIMRDMSADPTIAFALYYTETPLINATWSIECIAQGEQVLMADGIRRPIEELIPGDKVLSSDGTNICEDTITRIWDNGHKKVIKITLSDGSFFRVTDNHPVYSWNNWVEAGKLQVGDPVCIPRFQPEQNGDLSQSDAYLLAVWLAEGSKTKPMYEIANTSSEIISDLKKIAKDRGWNFGQDKLKTRVRLSDNSKKIDSSPYNILRKNNCIGMKTNDIHVPKSVMQATNEVVAEFLGAYIGCDGCVFEKGIQITSVSERIIRDFQILFRRFGIDSNIQKSKWHKENGQGNYIKWILTITSAQSITSLSENIYIPSKQDKLEILVEKCKKSFKTTDKSFPPSWKNDLDCNIGFLRSKGVNIRQGKASEKVWSSRRVVEKAIEIDSNTALKEKVRGSLGWAQVVSIEDDGISKVYDFTTENNHCMFLESSLVHNCEDAQIAAAVDAAFRPINTDFKTKSCNKLRMGYQPLVKRWKLGKLEGKYRDKNSDNPDEDRPVWPSKNVDALLFHTPLALPPENCLPRWNEMGNFNGFMYSPVPIPNPMMLGVAQTYGPQILSGYPIPLEWSMWIVNERSQNWGSLYGQPRLRRAYRYWWSFWYRWALTDRSFENKADPAKIIYFPTMVAEALDVNNPESETPYSLQQKAIQAGNNIRSGTTTAFPGDFMVNEEGKTMNQRQWEAKYLEGGENFNQLEQGFASLQTYMLRCVTGDTPIDCPRDHERYPEGIPIENLNPGDLVWTFNTERLEFELYPIKIASITKKEQDIYRINLSNGKYIKATKDHPFLSTDLEWKEVKDLLVGDKIVSFRRDYEPYVRISPAGGWSFSPEYKLVGKAAGLKNKYNIDPKLVHLHHIDERHANTSLDNLEAMERHEHMSITKRGTRYTAATRERIAKAHIKWTKDKIKERKDYLSEDDDLLLEERKYHIENGLRGTQDNKMYRIKICIVCGRNFAPTQGGEQRRCQACKFDGYIKENRSTRQRPYYTPTEPAQFHELCDFIEIASVEKENKKEDVWCLSVDGPESCHNFISQNLVLKNSMFLPEQAFIDATSAAQSSSQRYIAAQQGEIYQESQQILSNEDDEYVNKYMIPEFIAANFPDKAGIPCRKVTRKLRNPEFIKQLITLLGQKNPENLGVDVRALLEEEGVRTNSEAQQKILEDKLKAQQESNKPPIIAPTKKEGVAGYNAGIERTETGEHVYFKPGQELYLGADSITVPGAEAKNFLEKLPKIPAYQDATVRTAAVQMRKFLRDRYQNQIVSFANQIRNKTVLKLAQSEQEQPSKPGLSKGAAKIAAAGAVAAWKVDQAKSLPAASRRLKEILGRIAGAAGRRELKLAQLDPEIYDPSTIEDWINNYVEENLGLMDQTVQDQFKEFLERQLADNSHPDVVAQAIEDHFAEMPDTHTLRAVRAQTRDAYNQGMLKAAEDAGISQVMAHDASSGTNLNTDPKCIRRNGKVFSVKDARKETEHPNGTLYWTYLNTSNLSVEITEEIPDRLELSDNMMAAYDDLTETLYIKLSAKSSEEKYLLALGERLSFNGL